MDRTENNLTDTRAGSIDSCAVSLGFGEVNSDCVSKNIIKCLTGGGLTVYRASSTFVPEGERCFSIPPGYFQIVQSLRAVLRGQSSITGIYPL